MIRERGVACLTAVVLLLAACTAPSPAAPGATDADADPGVEPTRVQVVSAPNVFLSALYIAQDDGIFAEESLEVEIVEIESGADSVAALVSGNAQFADIGFDDLVTLSQEGEESLVMVHNILNRVTLTLVMRTDVAEELGISRDSPLEERWAALEGLRLGITSPGAPTDKYMRYYLRQAGLNPDADAEIIAIGGGASLLAALESDQIDAYHLSPPTPYVAETEGFGTVLIDGPSGDVPQFADFLYTGWASNRDWAAENPEAAQAFSRAIARAMEKVQSDSAGVSAQILPYIGSEDQEVTERTLEALLPALSTDGCFNEEGVTDSLATMFEAEIIGSAGDPAEGVLWTNDYNGC
ncbi:MAG: ABC transporter substrate-binding protein [Candidatus Limnocylindria bacterium]